MINLIPPHGNDALKREYLLRVGTIWSILLAGVFFAGAALSIPTYVLVSAQLENTAAVIAESADEGLRFKEAEATIRRTNDIALQLDVPETADAASDIIFDISRAAPSGVSITSFELKRAEGIFTSVRVQGVAPSRSTLASFTESLRSLPRVARAEVPISNLARDVDLPFALTIELKAQ